MKLLSRRLSAFDLLVTLVTLIIAFPFLEGRRHGIIIEAALLTLVLLAAVVVVGANRRMLALAIVLAAPAVVGRWINQFRPDLLPAEFYLACGILFVAFVAVNLLLFTLRAPRVNAEVLSAAAANYLMIGLLWTLAYLLVDRLVPGSFAFGSGPSGQSLSGFGALYFSFVTLCTVGYGDITPQSSFARTAAIAEATVGAFYMTVLVARLVALYSSEPPQPGAGEH